MKKYIILIWVSLLMIACRQDVCMESSTEKSSYVLTAEIGKSSADSRAQILFGNQEEGKEYFFWNKGDAFTLYQQTDGQLKETDFTISDEYDESQKQLTQVEFSSDKQLVPLQGYVAVYPAGVFLQAQKLTFALQNNLDFRSAKTEAAKQIVWKNYMRNNMFMMAEGKITELGRTYVHFKQLCSMARVTYVNRTEQEQQIDGIKLGGDQTFGSILTGNIMNMEEQTIASSGNLELRTQGLTVPAGETADFYLFFFPEEFGKGTMSISIQKPSNTQTVELPISDIASANNKTTSFEAGKRYWFSVTESASGLDWSKNMSLKEGILIANVELSKALSGTLGNYKVVLDKNGYAQMSQRHADEVRELDLGTGKYTISSLKGIEKFKNLEKLICNQTGLKECDFSQNKYLRSLSVNGNKELTTLDLSACIYVSELRCNDTGLTQVTFANANNISILHYGNTQLSFDWKSFPYLSSIDCSGHNIKGSLHTLFDENQAWYLKEIRCSSCKVKNFNLKDFVNLEILDCHDNQIKQLDLADLSNLKELYAGNQQDNINIQIYLNEEQYIQWNNWWKNDSRNAGAVAKIKGNTNSNDWGDGGEY